MNRWGALAVLLAIVGALALRLPQLDLRPLHNDEAVNAVKLTELWQHGRYSYDHDEYHGPTLHYFSLPFLWLAGPSQPEQLGDATLRLVTVAFGAGLILLLLLTADGLGRTATIAAAAFVAISPAMVFYSRYFIHEMLLVFFTALTIGAGWRYHQTRLARWALVAGVGVGLMFATKETFVLAIAAMGAAIVLQCFWKSPATGAASPSQLNFRHFALGSIAALVVWLLFFSSFGTHWAGLVDSVRTYFPWLKRAGGHSPHLHPWYFYFERLGWFHPARSPVWSEGLILALALIGAGVSLVAPKNPLHRFLALYTIFLTAIYAVITYKTPWCLLGFYHGMILLAGIGLAALLEIIRVRALQTAAVLAVVGLGIQLGWQSWRGAVEFAANPRNPYVYAQTGDKVPALAERIEALARLGPAGADTVVKVVVPGSGYWPLPWYLRRLHHVGWYDALPADPFAPIMVVASKFDARLDDKSDRKWIMAGMTELRPQVFVELYVELELWKQFVATLPREQD